jgi:hypothetical protein
MRKMILGLVTVTGLFTGPSALASDYGCTVLLCLANPAGPRAVAECVPPINRLFRDLARGRGFPTCAMASAPNSNGGASWAQPGVSYYDACPAGTTALPSGVLAMPGAGSGGPFHTGIGEGDSITPSGDPSVPMPSKVCVGTKLGDTYVRGDPFDPSTVQSVAVYDRVVLMDAHSSPNVIDVYVDSTFSHRVRW